MDDILKNIRNKSIRNAYFDTLKSMREKTLYVSTDDIIKELMKQSAPRFFITYDNARRIISLMHRNKPLYISNENKLSMYNEIYRRYLEYKNAMNLSGYCILEKIIEEPAPSYYVNIETMRGIIYKSIRTPIK